jgi:GNAT superfamily N-acetyltransferase
MTIEIEEALPSDVNDIHRLIFELATYEKAPEEMIITPEILLEDGFGKNKIFTCFVARINQEVVGISLLYTKYSTWKGKCIFLEDIIVTESYRSKGIGSLLFERSIQFAKDQNAGRLEWQVLDWNEPAIQFYKKFEALLDPTWINCKFTREQLAQIELKG